MKSNDEKRKIIDAMEKAGFKVIGITEELRDSYANAAGVVIKEEAIVVTIAPSRG
jgi:lipid II:glycine glycyltransferase (peptidoglycan interpeptide bridge formation enzyme)